MILLDWWFSGVYIFEATTQTTAMPTAPAITSSPVLTAPQCPIDSEDSCCIESKKNIFLQTQFWDYHPATGPKDVWTIHGLWSDLSSGGYEQFCNPKWEVENVGVILESLGHTELLQDMETNWKNSNGNDGELWKHEFNKHGTCMRTLDPGCYRDGTDHENVADYFQTAVNLWETLPSFKFLKMAGIQPSTNKTYTVNEFKKALATHVDGRDVYLGCDRNNAINEIWYFFNLQGPIASGNFTPIDSLTRSTCRDGFRWLPKGTKHPGHGDGDGDGNDTWRKGTLAPVGNKGCLISDGSWFTSGTCATFTVKTTTGGVSLSSSRGPCNVVDGSFSCGRGVTVGDFELKGSALSYNGGTIWSADHKPRHQQHERVYLGTSEVSFEINFEAKAH